MPLCPDTRWFQHWHHLGIIHQLASSFLSLFKTYPMRVDRKPLCLPFFWDHGNSLSSPTEVPFTRLEVKSGITHPSHSEVKDYFQWSYHQRNFLHKFSLIPKNPIVFTPVVNVCLRGRKVILNIFFLQICIIVWSLARDVVHHQLSLSFS